MNSANGSPPPPVHGINVMLGGAMLSGIILVVFIMCYCCHKNARKQETHLPPYWRDAGLPLHVYTVEGHRQRWSDFAVRENDYVRTLEKQCLEKANFKNYRDLFAYAYVNDMQKTTIRCYEECLYSTFGMYDTERNFNVSLARSLTPSYSYPCWDKCGSYKNNDRYMQSFCTSECYHGCLLGNDAFYQKYC